MSFSWKDLAERARRIELPTPAWEAGVMPFYDARLSCHSWWHLPPPNVPAPWPSVKKLELKRGCLVPRHFLVQHVQHQLAPVWNNVGYCQRPTGMLHGKDFLGLA